MQSAHAAHESGIFFGDSNSISSIVLCQVPNESCLEKESKRLDFLGVRHIVFTEPDIGDAVTALCTEPIDYNTRRQLKKLKLWRA